MNPQDQALGAIALLPLLFRNATPRTPGQDIPGQFDHHLSVWAIGECDERIPIIEASDADLLEIVTKTDIQQESDDQAVSSLSSASRRNGLLEIVTKTAVQQESDDDVLSCLDTPRRQHNLLEIETKTKVGGESDDEWPPSATLSELQTKTFVQQEADDDIDAGSLRILLELETKTEAQVEHDDESRPLL
jgi:hypothetical protein